MPDQLASAITEFQDTLRLRPEFEAAHISLGSALSRIPGRLPEAIAEYEAALRINPGSVKASNNLRAAQAQWQSSRFDVRPV